MHAWVSNLPGNEIAGIQVVTVFHFINATLAKTVKNKFLANFSCPVVKVKSKHSWYHSGVPGLNTGEYSQHTKWILQRDI